LQKNILALARLDTRQKKKAERTRPGAVIFFQPPSQVGNGIAYATRRAVTERPIDRRGPFRGSDEHVGQRQGGAESRVFANEMLAYRARLMNPPGDWNVFVPHRVHDRRAQNRIRDDTIEIAREPGK